MSTDNLASTQLLSISLSSSIRSLAESRLQRIVNAADRDTIPIGGWHTLQASLPILAHSEFITRICCREPLVLLRCLEAAPLSPSSYPRLVNEVFSTADDENDAKAKLRQLRNREMARIAWADLSAQCDIDTILAATSDLAEAIIEGARTYLHMHLCTQWGTPRGKRGQELQLVVVAMGKLGGGELNFSSDIDLIFAFAENGCCDGNRALDNSEFFTRLGRRLIDLLNDITAEGFVYRVDVRLRPFGESGPLAVSFDALEVYYQVHGREWERYAMIKARVVGSDRQAGECLSSILRPFVYRRYLDYGVIESLRELQTKIATDVANKGMRRNIKLGSGGIRKIEFIGQVFQLIRGGHNTALQTRSTAAAIRHLAEAGDLHHDEAETLLAAYRFLRRLENHLQIRDDEQTHDLPDSLEARLVLAVSMGFTNREDFEASLTAHRHTVEKLFGSILTRETEAPADTPDAISSLWRDLETESKWDDALSAAGFDAPDKALERLKTLKLSRFYGSLSTRARGRLDTLMPLALIRVIECDNPDETLSRLAGLLRAIAGRSVYLAMMLEVPAVLARLIRLLSASAWVAAFVTHHPLVIDELLHPSSDPAMPDRAMLETGARQALAQLPEDNLGERMDALRRYQQAQLLRIVSADLDGALTVMQVSDQLSWLAEALLQVASNSIWDELVIRHGRPICVIDDQTRRPGFGIVAYGKLGGIELGYGSDLDIVFLHESTGEQQRTDGLQPIDNAVLFARLAQKLVHFINTLTPTGTLYEVDTRLRPNGASGLLVSSINAFADYQLEQAWTWEHQALVRARMVVGSTSLRGHFERIRTGVLQLPRSLTALREEVVSMRTRMFCTFSKGDTSLFDIKKGLGGVADIEFMVQYLVLAWARQYPQLTRVTDNFRLLEFIGARQIIPRVQANTLTQSYLALRNCVHRLVLQDKTGLVGHGDIDTSIPDGVVKIWQSIMPDAQSTSGD